MPSTETPQGQLSMEESLRNVAAMLGRYHADVQIKTVDSGPSFRMQREQGGQTILCVNTSLLEGLSEERAMLQAITALDAFKSKVKMRQSGQFGRELNTYNEYRANPAYRLFYGMFDQFIAIHRPSIELVHQEALRASMLHSLERLQAHYPSVPKHIQFIFGLFVEKEAEDEEVNTALQRLKRKDIIEQVINPHLEDGKKLEIIHHKILQAYTHFLQQDALEWRHRRKKPPAEQVREEVQEVMGNDKETAVAETDTETVPAEETGSTPVEETDAVPETESGSPAAPAHTDRYGSSEGSQFENDPKGKGWKLEINPPLKDYFLDGQKSEFDPNTKEWVNLAQASPYTRTPPLSGKRYTMTGHFNSYARAQLPIPPNYAIDLTSFICHQGTPPTFYRDENGAFHMQMYGECQFSLDFAREEDPQVSPPTHRDTQTLYSGRLSAASEAVLSQAKTLSTHQQKVDLILNYIFSSRHYPPGKNELETANHASILQHELRMTPGNHILNLDRSPLLECFSASTLMVAMLRQLGIPTRINVGHRIDALNKQGKTEMNAGTGHGWCVWWDEQKHEWIGEDPTPPKDMKDPANQPDPGQENQPQEAPQKGGAESADDGVRKAPRPSGNDDEQSQESDPSEPSDASGNEAPRATDGLREEEQKIGDADAQEAEAEEQTDVAAEFQRMYEELAQDSPEAPPTQEIETAVQQMEFEQREADRREQERDPHERYLEEHYPAWTPEQIQKKAQKIKAFLKDLEGMNELVDPEDENQTLKEALAKILRRVVSWAKEKHQISRAPEARDGRGGSTLIDPVRLHFDRQRGVHREASPSFRIQEETEKEVLKIVKVRRRKVLDGSGSMKTDSRGRPTNKWRIQQQIEVLENQLIAEMQEELEALSGQLGRDVRYETETWQFGVKNETTRKYFSRLKALSSTFDLLEQAAVWEQAALAENLTNDYEPLEAIYDSILQESRASEAEEADQPDVLHQIRLGFLVRELNAYQKMKRCDEDELNAGEKIHFDHLSSENPAYLFERFTRMIPGEVTGEERNFLNDFFGPRAATDRLREWTQNLVKEGDILNNMNSFFRRIDPLSTSLAQLYQQWRTAMETSFTRKGKDASTLLNQVSQEEFAEVLSGQNLASKKFEEWMERFGQEKRLSEEEGEFFRDLDLSNTSLAEVYQQWQQVILNKYHNHIEPLLEVVEVTTDGASHDEERTRLAANKLRNLGAMVVVYALGEGIDLRDAQAAYGNDYNPNEGVYSCPNLLWYTRQKNKALESTLDHT